MTPQEKIRALQLGLRDNQLKAANGDLNAMRECEAIQEEIKRLQSGGVQKSAPAQGRPQPKRRGKGTAPATLQRIRAVAAVCYGDRNIPNSARALARAAVERAYDLKLPGAEAMDSDSKLLRDICAAFLDGIAAVEDDDKPA